MLQTRACCAARHLTKVCTSVHTLKGRYAPIASISRSQGQESRICPHRRERCLSRARAFARVASAVSRGDRRASRGQAAAQISTATARANCLDHRRTRRALVSRGAVEGRAAVEDHLRSGLHGGGTHREVRQLPRGRIRTAGVQSHSRANGREGAQSARGQPFDESNPPLHPLGSR